MIDWGTVGVIAAGFTTLAGTLGAVARVVAPIVNDKRNQAAFMEVTRAGYKAASAARSAAMAEFDKSRSPSSESGVIITKAEWHAIAKAGVDAGWASLIALGPGTMRNVLRYYGGEEAVLEAIGAIVHKALMRLGAPSNV